jgi:hypothetical protein
MTIWYILCLFGTFCVHLVHFFGFGIMYLEKSGNPVVNPWQGLPPRTLGITKFVTFSLGMQPWNIYPFEWPDLRYKKIYFWILSIKVIRFDRWKFKCRLFYSIDCGIRFWNVERTICNEIIAKIVTKFFCGWRVQGKEVCSEFLPSESWPDIFFEFVAIKKLSQSAT